MPVCLIVSTIAIPIKKKLRFFGGLIMVNFTSGKITH